MRKFRAAASRCYTGNVAAPTGLRLVGVGFREANRSVARNLGYPRPKGDGIDDPPNEARGPGASFDAYSVRSALARHDNANGGPVYSDRYRATPRISIRAVLKPTNIQWLVMSLDKLSEGTFGRWHSHYFGVYN